MHFSATMNPELELLATISHELRTPLTAVLGYARLLMSGKLEGDAAQHAIQALYRNALLQSKIVSDLLDISRIASGKLELRKEHVDFGVIVQNSLDSVRIAADSQSIALHSEAEEVFVIGDPARLQQIVSNLVTNAIKFTPPGGSVRVQLVANNGYAQLRVVDNGLGLSAEFLPHIFEKFRQADNSLARQNAGLGLGLALVRNLVEMHGGIVSAASAGIGKGATFTVKLPLRNAALKRAS